MLIVECCRWMIDPVNKAAVAVTNVFNETINTEKKHSSVFVNDRAVFCLVNPHDFSAELPLIAALPSKPIN